MSAKAEPIRRTLENLLEQYTTAPSTRLPVVLRDLTVVGAGKGIQEAPTIWTAIKSLINPFRPRTYSHTQPSRTLLHDFTGVLAQGEMVLVIGKPGSGCTTFLKTMSNMRGEYKEVTGTLTYGGRAPSSKDEDPVRFTFCGEEDKHLPTLTVAETLRFAVRCTWAKTSAKSVIDSAVDNLARCVGLSSVTRTKVGSDKVQGVSGGERRRVSLAEAMATMPDVLCYDNPTNGLDASTALEFMEMMRSYTTLRGSLTIMSVYQGSNAMIPYFDKILVIHSGRQIFFGPSADAVPYFEDLGLQMSERMAKTNFLNSMTGDPRLRGIREGFEDKVPRTAIEFEAAFRRSKYSQANRTESAEAASSAKQQVSKRRAYSLPGYTQILLCAKRQFRVLFTDRQTLVIEATCSIIQSLFLGTLFRDQKRETRSFFILASSLFFTVLIPALQSLSEFSNTFAQRDLVMRHKQFGFHRPMTYALGLVLTDVAWKILAITFSIPQYFLTGFQMTGAKFMTWFFALYVEHLALSMMFRAIAVFSPNMGVAALPVGIMFNVFVLYTGFYIPPPQMQVWLSWLRFLNPLHYTYETIVTNEFGNLDYVCSNSDLAPTGPGYGNIANQVCAVVGSTPGSAIVSGKSYIQAQYGFEIDNLWRNVGINLVFFGFFAVCTGVGMEMYKPAAGKLATVFYKDRPETGRSRDTSITDSERGKSDDVPSEPATDDHLGRVSTHNGRSLSWKQLTLDIQAKKDTKRILDRNDGTVSPGTLTALMGVSGAGKTTLLNTLAGRIEFGNLSGNIYLDGSQLPKSFKRQMGFVPQQDIHLPTQTVREALRLTAGLRRPPSVPQEEKMGHVEHVIQILEMGDIANALIGVPGAGLNLEQRKKVTIGVELAAVPDILFLDEPSSGLDGQSALSIARLLRKLADSGQTILCTIHQPAAEVIEPFDNLVLLLRGGKVGYNGPLGEKSSTALAYFEKHARACGLEENPAEYLLEVVGAGSRNKNTIDWAQIWADNPKSGDVVDGSTLTKTDSGTTAMKNSENDNQFAMPFTAQLKTIVLRTWLYYWRDPNYFTSKILMSVSNALLNGLTYLNSPETQNGAYNRVFSAFISLIIGPPLSLQVEERFFNLREIFVLREKGSQTYHWMVFVAAAIIVELPFALLTGLAYWLLWYFPAGYFTESSRAGYSFLMYELFSVFCVSLGQFIAALMPNLASTFASNGFFWLWINTWAGTLIPRPSTPTGWRWYYNVAPLFYFSEGFVTDVLQGLPINCAADETSIFQPPEGQQCAQYAAEFLSTATGYLLDGAATADCQYCRYRSGETYYLQFGYDFANRYNDVGIFIGFIAFNFTCVIALTYVTRIFKWRRN